MVRFVRVGHGITELREETGMTKQDYRDHFEAFVAEMREVTLAKNEDYSAGTADAMNDYKCAAVEADVTPVQAWLVLMMKHVRAIQRYAKTGSVSSEAIHGRFVDLANYAMLGDALVKDLAAKAEQEVEIDRIYPCSMCGKLRTKKEGGTTFAVCDECWDKDKELAK